MELYQAIDTFGALGQETRLEALRLLIRAGTSGVGAGDVAAALGVAPPTLSFHLKELERTGLVASTREGRRVIYRADYSGVRALIDFLLKDCCQGDPRLCGPQTMERIDETPAHTPAC